MNKRRRSASFDVGSDSEEEEDRAEEKALVIDNQAPASEFSSCANRNCIVNGGGILDIRPHEDDEDNIYPCPLMFSRSDTTFMKGMLVADPEWICTELTTFTENDNACECIIGQIFNMSEDESPLRRKLIGSFFRNVAIYRLVVESEHLISPDELVDHDVVKGFLDMIELTLVPFSDIDDGTISVENYKQLNFVFYTWFTSTTNFSSTMKSVISNVGGIIQTGTQCGDYDSSISRQLGDRLMRIGNSMDVKKESFVRFLTPTTNIFQREGIQYEKKDHALKVIQTALCGMGTIVTNSDTPSHITFALPIRVNNLPTYTYTKGMSLPELLRESKADPNISRFYADCTTFINMVLSANHRKSPVPYVPDEFINGMRYVSWKNGIFCVRTCIMYYHNKVLCPPQLRRLWKHYTSELNTINDGQPRAMKYIDKNLDYYNTVTTMLQGVYLRRTKPEVVRKRIDTEEKCIHQTHGGDTDDGSVEQKEFVEQMWSTFDDWVHDADFLAEIDPIDVNFTSLQKIMQNQEYPRNVYRHLLEAFGRSLCGVVGNETREVSGSQRYIEEKIGRLLSDRMEFASVFEGSAGTGKSTLLNMLQVYFSEHLIGHVSDEARPIDHHGTTRNKGVVIAADMQVKKDSMPISGGEIKKIVSNEAIVNNILNKMSKIIKYLVHVILAMNYTLPYKDKEGDIYRRFVRLINTKRVGNVKMGFDDGDNRTPGERFEEDDIVRGITIFSFAHKRALLNVGNKPFYKREHPAFPIPKYLLKTQSDYLRKENSFRAFLIENENSGAIKFGVEYDNTRTNFANMIENYKLYYDHHKCTVVDNDSIIEQLKNSFGCVIGGEPLTITKMFYQGVSDEPDGYSAEVIEEEFLQ